MKKLSTLLFISGLTTGVLVTSAIGQGGLGSLIFPDVPVGSYYDASIGEMASLGIITGFADGTFKPNDPLSRGQAAVLMKRLRDEIKGITSSSSSRSSVSSSSSSRSSSSSSTSSSSSSSSIPSSGLVRFTASQYRVNEDAGTVTVTLVRAAGNRGVVTVDYTLVADSATEDEDYEKQEGTVRFDSGVTSARFDLAILDDQDQEGDETFKITLDNITGGAGRTTPDEATILINDDETASSSSSSSVADGPEEGTFKFSALDFAASEEIDTATIRVVRTGGDTGSVSVNYGMTNGTARSSNYNSTSGVLNFSGGETEKTFTITILDNSDMGGNKTVNLSLSNPTGGAEIGDSTALLTIYDDENSSFGSGSLKLSHTEFEVLESDGEAIITIKRLGGAMGEVSVKFKTISNTATAGSDYENVDEIIVFKDGEASKTVIIPVLKDLVSDGGESVNLRLQDPTGGATIITPSTAILYIY